MGHTKLAPNSLSAISVVKTTMDGMFSWENTAITIPTSCGCTEKTALTSHDVRKDVGTATFTNVVGPYIVTITKHNYIPFLRDLPDEYIQNETFATTETRMGGNIYAGKNVTISKPHGDVIIRNGAKLTLKAQKSVYLEQGFEVEQGGKLEINTNTNN